MAKKKSKDKDKSASKGSRKQLNNRGANVHVDTSARAYDQGLDTPLIGHFATVEKGEHEGAYGVVDQVASFDKDGWPESVIFVTRDDDAQTFQVDYSDLKAAVAGRR